jgi:mannan endo-1,4-beta-mannosidase
MRRAGFSCWSAAAAASLLLSGCLSPCCHAGRDPVDCSTIPFAAVLAKRTVQLPASGAFVVESHLATKDDVFPQTGGRSGDRLFPKPTFRVGRLGMVGSDELIQPHLDRELQEYRKFFPATAFADLFDSKYVKEWTPAEGGKPGQGSVGNTRPSVAEEIWLANMFWSGKGKPKPGTRFLMSANGKHVVVAMGYETGPGGTNYLGGAQGAVFKALGLENGGLAEIACLKDQTLPFGPVDCRTPAVLPRVEKRFPPLVDAGATPASAALFSALKKTPATGILVGQQDAFTHRHGKGKGDDATDMKLTCGKNPAVLGLDFMFITDVKNTPGSWFEKQEEIIKEQARAARRRGAVVIFAWHFRNPYTHDWFSVSKKPETLALARKSLPSILEGGENHEYYKSVLDTIARVFGELKDDRGDLIPVIFRPFHEFDGDWFWWGVPYCTSEQFKANWTFTVRYLRDERKVHNVLYAFSPDNRFTTEAQYLARYPGDEFVDLMGMDNYSDFEAGKDAEAAQKLQIVSDCAKAHGKLAALTEVGYRKKPIPADWYTGRLLNALRSRPVELSFLMFWSNTPSLYYVPTPDEQMASDFVKFVEHPLTLLEGDVPDIYAVGR